MDTNVKALHQLVLSLRQLSESDREELLADIYRFVNDGFIADWDRENHRQIVYPEQDRDVLDNMTLLRELVKATRSSDRG